MVDNNTPDNQYDGSQRRGGEKKIESPINKPGSPAAAGQHGQVLSHLLQAVEPAGMLVPSLARE